MVDDSNLLQRRERTELIAHAEAEELVELAETLLGRLGQPTVVNAPEVGLVMLTVREPVCGDRFHLGEVMVTRAEAPGEARKLHRLTSLLLRTSWR